VAQLIETPDAFRLRLEGPPIAQPRQRFRVIGKFVRPYNDGKHPVNAYKAALATLARLNWRRAPMDGALESKVLFILARSKPGAWKISRPDIDNQIKSIWDALTGIVFVDDAQIASVKAWKRFAGKDEREAVEIEIASIDRRSPPWTLFAEELG
jgi:Holliday junction resolvase RusA-like endonuclease